MSLTAKKHGRFTTIPDDLLMFEVLACLPHQIPHMLLNSDVSPAHCTLTLQTSPSYVATMSRPVWGHHPYTTSWRCPTALASTASDDSEHRWHWRLCSSSGRRREEHRRHVVHPPRSHCDRLIVIAMKTQTWWLVVCNSVMREFVALSSGSHNANRARWRRLWAAHAVGAR
jgi:hypothetical protein